MTEEDAKKKPEEEAKKAEEEAKKTEEEAKKAEDEARKTAEEGAKKDAEELFKAFDSNVTKLNNTLLQMTKDGVQTWQKMADEEYSSEVAFKDAAVFYARSVSAWRDWARVWTGYSAPEKPSS
jgi:membrane protein involved in colicin uptake